MKSLASNPAIKHFERTLFACAGYILGLAVGLSFHSLYSSVISGAAVIGMIALGVTSSLRASS